MALGWDSFGVSAGDDVLFLVLQWLQPSHVLDLVLASAAAVQYFTGADEASCYKVSGIYQSLVYRLVVHRLGGDALAEAAVAAALKMVHTHAEDHASGSASKTCQGKGLLFVLRMLDGSIPCVDALDEFILLHQVQSSAAKPSVAHIQAFHETLFGAETRSPYISVERPDCVAALAADAALTAMFCSDDAVTIVFATAEAVRDWERKLDIQVEEGRIACPGWFEAVARQRSAVEFFRCRLDSAGSAAMAQIGFWDARRDLDQALDSLDATIDSYMREGYDLSCPRLVGGVRGAYCKVPYSHWWVFFGGQAGSPGLTTGRPRTSS
jgi:hypothetical protein